MQISEMPQKSEKKLLVFYIIEFHMLAVSFPVYQEHTSHRQSMC